MNTTLRILKNRWLVLVLLAILVAGGGYLLFGSDETELAPTTSAQTPSGPATAPSSASGLAAYDLNGDGIVYQDGMHPQIVQDEPGNCPICGMELMPVKVDGGSEEGVVQIDPVTIQNIGVRTAPVAVAPLARTVRTTGRFASDERARTAVSLKVGGWVERLHVDYEGARVRRGQPLLELYSPELVSTQEEYLLAYRNAQKLGGASNPDAARLLEAARRRLAYWDITEAQIAELERTGKPRKTLTLYAPTSGTVEGKKVFEGQRVMPGETLMEIADLSRIWLMVDVYEQDLAWVRPGTAVSVELPYDPTLKRAGKVDYLYDTLDPMTRTVQARVTLPNPDLALKPGMYATVTLQGGEAAPLPVVPEEALIRTGSGGVVIVALGEGRFRPVEVTPGVGADGRVQILAGLAGGETVVTSAQFLIDSEARLQSAVGAMAGGHNHGGGLPAGGERAGNKASPAAPVEDHSAHTSTPVQARRQGDEQVVEVTVTASGFEPAQIALEAGRPARLVFTRKTETTCATDVQIPAYGIAATKLPLGEPVAITFTPDAAGTFTFACGMDMIQGSLLVKS